MSDLERDSDLRAKFAAQKRIDATRTPAFAEVLAQAHERASEPIDLGARRQSPTRFRRYAWLGGLAAAATIVALVVIPRVQSKENEFEQTVRAFHSDPALGGWRSPTDGLLDLPGSRLIATTPSISLVP